MKNLDITLKVKNFKKTHSKTINDEDLNTAFSFASLEAKKWYSAAKILEKTKNMDVQVDVCYLFSIEIALKGLLMSKGINVTLKKYGHDISKMYNDLDINSKNRISDEVGFDNKPLVDIVDRFIKFESFEDELDFISNDFISLRYQFETYLNGQSIFLLNTFIKNLAFSILKLANEELNNIF